MMVLVGKLTGPAHSAAMVTSLLRLDCVSKLINRT